MLVVILFMGLVAAGLYVLWRGIRTSGSTTPIRSIDELNTFIRSGTVVDQQTRSVTTIQATTTGGTTLLADGVGTASHPSTKILTSTYEVTRMFLRDGDGAEFEVEVEELGFGVRPGHAVKIVYAGNRESREVHAMAVANNATGQSAVLLHRVEWLVRRRSATLGCAALAIVPFVAMLVASVLLRLFLGPAPDGHTGYAILFGIFTFVVVGLLMLLGRSQTERLKREIVTTMQRQLA